MRFVAGWLTFLALFIFVVAENVYLSDNTNTSFANLLNGKVSPGSPGFQVISTGDWNNIVSYAQSLQSTTLEFLIIGGILGVAALVLMGGSFINDKTCPNCRSKIRKTMAFCPVCGQKQLGQA